MVSRIDIEHHTDNIFKCWFGLLTFCAEAFGCIWLVNQLLDSMISLLIISDVICQTSAGTC